MYCISSVVSSWKNDSGRLVIAEFSRNDLNFQIASLYGPNNKKDSSIFFESFYQALDPDLPVSLCGDFNTVVDSCSGRLGCNPRSSWAYNSATYDVHPGVEEFMWRRASGGQASRIDMIWLLQQYPGLVSSVGIFPFFRSGHSYVYLEINLPSELDRGKGLWKFNTSHLKDEVLCSEIAAFWADWRHEWISFFLSLILVGCRQGSDLKVDPSFLVRQISTAATQNQIVERYRRPYPKAN